jgi:uncharacterized protein YjiS (DUF1127 family)
MSTHSVSSGTNVFVPIQTSWLSHRWFAAAICEWRRRIASRRELAALTERDVKDLGYPAGLEVEKCKPFWRG